jgi:hypothetical protein
MLTTAYEGTVREMDGFVNDRDLANNVSHWLWSETQMFEVVHNRERERGRKKEREREREKSL